MASAPVSNAIDDESKFTGIYDRYKRSVWAYLYRAFCGGDPEIASDLTQESFVRAFLGKPSILEASSEQETRVWIFRHAFTAAVDAYRKRQTRRRAVKTISLDDPHVQQIAAPDDHERSDDLDVMREQLESLPEEQRSVLLLWADDCTIDEIVAITGKTSAKVKSLRSKAIYRIKAGLTRNGTIKTKKSGKDS